MAISYLQGEGLDEIRCRYVKVIDIVLGFMVVKE